MAFAVPPMSISQCNSMAIKLNRLLRWSVPPCISFSNQNTCRSFLIPRNIFLLDTVLDSRPNQLMENSDHLGMIDAGFFINTSSPPLLRPQRDVDVIIYLSYTTGSHTSVRRILLLLCLVSPCECLACSA